MIKQSLVAAILLAVTAPAFAQSGPPGMPLTRSVNVPQETAPTARTGSALALGAPPPVANVVTTRVDVSATPEVPSGLRAAALDEPYVVDPRPELAAQTLSRDVADQQSRIGPVTGRSPGGDLTLQSGRNEVMQIARDHLNRFVTPFANPVVKTTALATTTSAEGSIVYVATASTEPVSLFVIDGDNPENALTLTLIPRDIPAVSTTLHLEGYIGGAVASRAEAEAYENADSFVANLRETFRSLAQGEIPPGYGMRPIRGYNPDMPECVMPGLKAFPAQEIAGGDIIVLVSKLTNVTAIPQTVDETRCASDRVLAVAAWPNVDLRPGQSTELYIAVRRDAPAAANHRPSVL